MKAKLERRTQNAEVSRLRKARWLVAFVFLWVACQGRAADTTAPAAAKLTEQVRFDQNLGASVPLDAVFLHLSFRTRPQ